MSKLYIESVEADLEKMKIHLVNSDIKYLYISFAKQSLAGFLPRGLVELDICGYDYSIDIGTLPASLKRLSLNSPDEILLNWNELPPNLEFLELETMGTFGPTGENSLPKSLKTILCCPVSWIKHLKHLPALETLTIKSSIAPEHLSPGDFPSSLTSLHLSEQYPLLLKPGMIPPSIRILHIVATVNLEDGLLPRDAHYEQLSLYNVSGPIQPGQLPPAIKELELQGYTKALVPGSLPAGIEVLKLPKLDASLLQDGVIPPSVRHALLFVKHSEITAPIHFKLPQSIESLNLASYSNKEFQLDFTLLPDSIREITCRIENINPNHTIDSIKETVTKITLCGYNLYYYHLHRIDKQHYIVVQTIGIKIMNSKEITNLLQNYLTYQT